MVSVCSPPPFVLVLSLFDGLACSHLRDLGTGGQVPYHLTPILFQDLTPRFLTSKRLYCERSLMSSEEICPSTKMAKEDPSTKQDDSSKDEKKAVKKITDFDSQELVQIQRTAMAECDWFKQKYDRCFNNWFRYSFLRGTYYCRFQIQFLSPCFGFEGYDTSLFFLLTLPRGNMANSCDDYFDDYKACIMEQLQGHGLTDLTSFQNDGNFSLSSPSSTSSTPASPPATPGK